MYNKKKLQAVALVYNPNTRREEEGGSLGLLANQPNLKEEF